MCEQLPDNSFNIMIYFFQASLSFTIRLQLSSLRPCPDVGSIWQALAVLSCFFEMIKYLTNCNTDPAHLLDYKYHPSLSLQPELAEMKYSSLGLFSAELVPAVNYPRIIYGSRTKICVTVPPT